MEQLPEEDRVHLQKTMKTLKHLLGKKPSKEENKTAKLPSEADIKFEKHIIPTIIDGLRKEENMGEHRDRFKLQNGPHEHNI